ncbi:MAG: formate/nitrite transporter family protein [Firmicutes bacterium]|nr:formate/nitrite transporter family protein [Bacillota bacterium]
MMYTPAEVTKNLSDVGVIKAGRKTINLILLGALAGAYISIAGSLSQVVGHDIAQYLGFGMARFITGSVFSLGLVLVVLAGAELFTGNCLIIISLLDRRISWGQMLRNWVIIWLANALGAALVVALTLASGIGAMNGGAVGQFAITGAADKLALPFATVFFKGIFANWMVCLAVWLASSAKDAGGKILAIYLPIMGFVAINLEHSIANMFSIPFGLALAGNLNWQTLIQLTVNNLLPATLGNIVGGAVLVGAVHWYLFSPRK